MKALGRVDEIREGCMATSEQLLKVTQIKPLIGAVVEADKATLLGGRAAKQIRALLEDRGVLIFPKVGFDDDEQIAFTSTLGELGMEYNGLPGKGGELRPIFKVSLDEEINPMAANGLKTSFYWHLDGTMHETPILASLLGPRILSPSGGQTEFCNTYAAYDALPDEDKQLIAKMRVFHANWARDRVCNPEPSYAWLKRQQAGPSRFQPMVWTHRSGRKSLVIGATASHVEGLEPWDSWDLLVRLRDFATQPQFVCRHEWSMGDLVIWDNTGTLHRALPYDHDCGRLMHRTMLAGEEPFA
jgi:alpha-ketoglutarate-dependent taurine dioxygenase